MSPQKVSAALSKNFRKGVFRKSGMVKNLGEWTEGFNVKKSFRTEGAVEVFHKVTSFMFRGEPRLKRIKEQLPKYQALLVEKGFNVTYVEDEFDPYLSIQ